MISVINEFGIMHSPVLGVPSHSPQSGMDLI